MYFMALWVMKQLHRYNLIKKINSCAKSARYARCQHSYNICKDFLSHNSWMKNLNFTKKYTDRKTINSNNCAKFEVNWPKGSQFTAWHMQKSPSIWRIKSHNSGMKNWNFTIKYTDRKTINSNNSAEIWNELAKGFLS